MKIHQNSLMMRIIFRHNPIMWKTTEIVFQATLGKTLTTLHLIPSAPTRISTKLLFPLPPVPQLLLLHLIRSALQVLKIPRSTSAQCQARSWIYKRSVDSSALPHHRSPPRSPTANLSRLLLPVLFTCPFPLLFALGLAVLLGVLQH